MLQILPVKQQQQLTNNKTLRVMLKLKKKKVFK